MKKSLKNNLRKRVLNTRFFIIFFSLIFLNLSVYSLNFDSIELFKIGPNLRFNYVSDNNNSISINTKIILSESDNIEDYIIYQWNLKIFYNKLELNYNLSFHIHPDGNIYLFEINDGLFERFITNYPLVFPSTLSLNKEITIGNNISLRYISDQKDSSSTNYTEAILSLDKDLVYLYFIRKKGLMQIKYKDEIFRLR